MSKSETNSNDQFPNNKNADRQTEKRDDLFETFEFRIFESRYSSVLCDGVTIEVPPLEKGVRGIF